MKKEGGDLRQNYRPFMKEGVLKVDHLHFHLIPRAWEDEIYNKSQIFEKDIFKKLDVVEINEVKSKIVN